MILFSKHRNSDWKGGEYIGSWVRRIKSSADKDKTSMFDGGKKSGELSITSRRGKKKIRQSKVTIRKVNGWITDDFEGQAREECRCT